MDKSLWKKLVDRSAVELTRILAIAFVLSLFASWHWLPDLFSHFTFQYMVGGLILGGIFLWTRNRKYGALAFAIAFLSLVEIVMSTGFTPARAESGQPTLTVVTYNRLFVQFRHDDLRQWLTDNKNHFDVVILQEANQSLVKLGREMSNLFPYQIHEPRNGAFGMVIFSRYPLEEQEQIPFSGTIRSLPFENFALRFVVQPDGFEQPAAIYALHTIPPMGKDEQARRNSELAAAGKRVAADDTPHIIMAGDWNITPWSPYFRRLLKTTGLKAQYNTLIPAPTWPSLGFPWLFQIPIDHILASESLSLLRKYRYWPMGSDHHPLIATFSEEPL